jgi:hypothetical protein
MAKRQPPPGKHEPHEVAENAEIKVNVVDLSLRRCSPFVVLRDSPACS